MPPTLLPTILSEKNSDHSVEYLLYAPKNLSFFEHHFQSCPIVPGVSQIQWVMSFIPASLGNFGGINNLKFNRPITPELTFSLVIIKNDHRKTAAFRFFDDLGNFSSGQIVFK